MKNQNKKCVRHMNSETLVENGQFGYWRSTRLSVALLQHFQKAVTECILLNKWYHEYVSCILHPPALTTGELFPPPC